MEALYLIAGMALVTFIARYLMFGVARYVAFPRRLVRTLRYMPPAVLTAIIVPAVLMPAGQAVSLSYSNAYLVGGLAAFCVGWLSRNIWLTLPLGLLAFWGWQWLVGI